VSLGGGKKWGKELHRVVGKRKKRKQGGGAGSGTKKGKTVLKPREKEGLWTGGIGWKDKAWAHGSSGFGDGSGAAQMTRGRKSQVANGHDARRGKELLQKKEKKKQHAVDRNDNKSSEYINNLRHWEGWIAPAEVMR